MNAAIVLGASSTIKGIGFIYYIYLKKNIKS
jgi:hypothetical protein